MKVVVVDDALPNAMLAERLLSQIDFVEVSVFTHPQEALDWCAAETPDLVILDYLMPDIDGREFLQRFTALEKNRHVPIIVVTADEHQRTLHEMLEAGATDFIRKPVDPVELIARSRNLLRLREYQKELNQTVDRLHVMATTDALTGVANRRHFLERATVEAARSRRFSEPLSIAMLDADHFKGINDAYGHAAGDRVLADLADACRDALRSHDIVGRIGGEEFGICMPQTPLDKAELVCNRLRETIEKHSVRIDAVSIQYTVSIGVAAYRPDQYDAQGVISRADAALYQAKESGRNRVVVAG
ncbi:MAG: diguanylate cyclase [Alphaproteobacteria bacterium]|nr:diguanylate cyclase [Alphaproteobacteria bacterium]